MAFWTYFLKNEQVIAQDMEHERENVIIIPEKSEILIKESDDTIGRFFVKRVRTIIRYTYKSLSNDIRTLDHCISENETINSVHISENMLSELRNTLNSELKSELNQLPILKWDSKSYETHESTHGKHESTTRETYKTLNCPVHGLVEEFEGVGNFQGGHDDSHCPACEQKIKDKYQEELDFINSLLRSFLEE